MPSSLLGLALSLLAIPLALSSTPKTAQFPPNSKFLCSDRCHRLLRRSLDRVDQSLGVDAVLYRIGTFRKAQLLSKKEGTSSEEVALPAKDFKEICWKFFDFEDCQKQCQKIYKEGTRRRKRRRGLGPQKEKGLVEPEHRLVLHFCRRTDFGVPLEQFACLHKYHSFLEVHCSAYQQRAVQVRLIGLQLEQADVDVDEFGGKRELARLRKALDQELCLLVHQHSSCLVNSGTRFCPQLRSAPQPLLSRHSLREHFLSLLLPFGRAIDKKHSGIGQTGEQQPPLELDQLFPEHLLDHCQLFDFHKMAKDWMERRGEEGEGAEAIGQQREFELAAERAGEAEQRSTTKRAARPKILDGQSTEEEGDEQEVTVAPSNRRVFSSQEDLLDTPPNFFYSTARLPKDFYSRYAVWWGSRGEGGGGGRAEEGRKSSQDSREQLTSVQLLPSSIAPRAHAQGTVHPNGPILGEQRRKTTLPPGPLEGPVPETGPDSTLSTPLHTPAGEDVGTSVTMPYLVNGQVTSPVERWPGEVSTTEIRLMDGTSRRIWTVNEQEEAEWRRREQAEGRGTAPAHGRGREEEGGGRGKPVEEYEEEWAYEDEFGSSQFEEEEEGEGEEGSTASILRTVTSASSSSVEELIKEIEPSRGQLEGVRPTMRPNSNGQKVGKIGVHGLSSSSSSSREEEGVQLLPTSEEPMFRETNIYFAKILEFGKEPEEEAEWMAGRRGTSSPKTVAHMVHFPGDQLPARQEHPKSAELDQHEGGRWPADGRRVPHQQQQPNPYEILPADPNQFMLGPKTTTPVNWKNGFPPPANSAERSKILVSAEPVPSKKSETLLVLLGVYLTFFALASFFLFCLVLTCLERNRRQASRRQSAKANSGSAILYMDPKNGTLKHVV